MAEPSAAPETRTRTPRGVIIALIVIGVVALAALAISLLAWLRPFDAAVASGDSYRDSGFAIGSPTIVSQDELEQFGRTYGPIYWAGPQADSQYELTITADGSYYVRYLPTGVEAGAGSDYVSVATYAVVGGYDLLTARGEEDGATTVQSESGALVLTIDDDPSRAYFAFPDQDFQVEVFSPADGEALELVSDGSILPAM